MLYYNVYVYNKAMMEQGIGGKASAGKIALRLNDEEKVKKFIEEKVDFSIEGICIEMEVL